MKLKRLLSIVLPILGIVTTAGVAALLDVSCGSNSSGSKPSNPDNNNGGNSNSGGSNSTPENKPEANVSFFTYTQDRIDTVITGLTAEGQKQTKITILEAINSKKVVRIDFTSIGIPDNSVREVFFWNT